jgi:hypothetical protein
MEAKHTATPWYVEKQTYKSSSFYIRGSDENGNQLAWAKGAVAHIPRSTVMPSKANAEFIVRACNAHDDLVKAIHAALSLNVLSEGRVNPGSRMEEVRNMLSAALAKAGVTC